MWIWMDDVFSRDIGGQWSDSQCRGKQFFTLDSLYLFCTSMLYGEDTQHVVMQGKNH